SLELSRSIDHQEHVARASSNLGGAFLKLRQYERSARHLDAAIAYCGERDLHSWLGYALAWKARLELEQGRWDEALPLALRVLEHPERVSTRRFTALLVVALLRLRRGDPDAWTPLDEALEIAQRAGELQRLAPVAAARAEARWLGGQPDAIAAETEDALALARRVGD